MVSEAFVLDASALLCLLNGEPGAGRVAEVMSRSSVSAVNLSEVVSKLVDAGGARTQIERALAALHLNIVPFDAAQAFAAGAFRTQTKRFGLSIGDRSCLALAKIIKATALTTDGVWADLAESVDTKVEVIRR